MKFNWSTGILLDTQAMRQLETATKVDPAVRSLLESKEFDKLEDMVLEHIEKAPDDIQFYLPILRALLRHKDKDRAQIFLQFILDGLRSKGNDSAEIELLRTVISFWPESDIVRKGLVDNFRRIYTDSSALERLVKHFKVLETPVGVDMLRQMELWLRYDEGRAVYMPTKGPGRVKEVNPTLGVIRVLFEGKQKEIISFRFAEAQRLIEPLAPGHFMADKLDKPQELIALAESEPGELLRRLFLSFNKPMTTSELKEHLSGIVPDTRWSSWWSKARQNQKLTIGTGSKPVVTWSDSASAAEDGIAEVFAKAPVLEKLDILKKHGDRSPELRARMSANLREEATKLLRSDSSLALEIALAIEKDAPATGGGSAGVTPQEIIVSGDIAEAIIGIQDRILRKKAVALVKELRGDWPAIFAKILKTESDSPTIAYIYDTLRSDGQAALAADIIDETLAYPHESPRLFMWVCKEMNDRSELQERINWDFLQQILEALSNDIMKPHYAGLRKLFDPGEVADRAAVALNTEQAKHLLAQIDRDIGLEEYRRDHLRAMLHEKHPELNEQKIEYLYVTARALQAKRVEFEKLVRVEIPHNSSEIKRTREYGDLRENFEYHAARARQELLSSRAKTLHDDLARARIIDPKTINPSVASLGTRVSLEPHDGGEELAISILGPWDSDPSNNIISYTASAATSILGAREGATVTYNERTWVIKKIEHWTEEE